jgi:regulator of replication initiation timing
LVKRRGVGMTDKEVKQLTKTVNQQKHEISRLIDINNTLKMENEDLKEQLKNLRRLVNEAYMEGSE